MANELAFRPTLLVGVGGTGCRIAETVYRRALTAGDTMKGRVQVIGFDTDENDMRRRRSLSDQQRVRFSTNVTVEELLDRYPEVERDWFVPRATLPMEIRRMTMLDGAAQIRMFTRLALHDALRQQGIQNAIGAAVQGLAQHDNRSGYAGKINVLMLGSLAGATGSGSFLQLAMLIKDICEKRNVDASTRGLFLMPDIYVRSGALPSGQIPNVLANGYASFKEFHAINMRATERAGRYDFDFEFAPGRMLRAGDMPFLSITLIDSEDMKGGNLGRSIDAYRRLAEEAAYTLLFSPVGQKADSQTINDARQKLAVAGRGTHDTAAAIGLSSIVYPHEEIVGYLGKQLARDVLSGDWLRLDQSYRARLARFRDQRAAGNTTVSEPDIGLSYLDDMRQFALDVKVAFFRELWEELNPTVEDPTEGATVQPLHVRYLDALDEQLVSTFWNGSEVAFRDGGEVVKISERRFADVDQFASEQVLAETVRRHEARLDDDWRRIERELQTGPTDIVINLLTTSDDSGEADWRDHHLQTYLVRGGPHLVRNRAFLHALHRLILERLAALQADETRKRLYLLANAFDVERGRDPQGRGSPKIVSDAAGFGQRSIFRNPFKGGAKEWVDQYVTYYNGSLRTMRDYAVERLKQKAYELLKDEVEEQLRVLAGLFLEVEGAMGRLGAEIRDDERRHQPGAVSENKLYVCADAPAKNGLWEELRDAAAGQRLAPAANKSLALEVYAKARRIRKSRRPESLEDLRDLFWRTVVEDFAIKRVREDFRAVHDMSLVRAIEKECQFLGLGRDALKARLHEMVRTVQNQSEPMISLTKATDGQLVRLWPINPALRREIEAFENVDNLLNAGEQGAQTAEEPEFSMTELACVSFRVNLELAHIAKLGPAVKSDGSVAPDRAGRYFEEYRRMVDEIVDAAANNRIPGTFTPHVHRDWHKPGILPEIVEGETIRLVAEVNRAFMAAILLGDLKLSEKHGKRIVEVSTIGKVPVGSVSLTIAEGHDMYDAIRAFERHPEAGRACLNHWKHEMKQLGRAASSARPPLLEAIEQGQAIERILPVAENRDNETQRDGRVRDLITGHAMLIAEAVSAFRPDLPHRERLEEADRLATGAGQAALGRLMGKYPSETWGYFETNAAKGMERWRQDSKLVQT